MKRVFLGGTTTRTKWREELIARLEARGVRSDQIINPYLPHGVPYTPAHMKAERRVKNDPSTIVLIYICPAVTTPDKAERLGPISMKEIGQYGWSQPHRTAVVLASDQFTAGRRPRKVLEDLANELTESFGAEGPPYFSSLSEAEDWIVAQLTG
jgi:hypothetical protein